MVAVTDRVDLSLSDLGAKTISFYNHLTNHYVPGPQSLSYLFSIILMPVALLIPPSHLPHRLIRLVLLPTLYANLVHAWFAIGGLDVISMTVALWATVLLGIKDGRQFVRLRYRQTRPLFGAQSKVHHSQKSHQSNEHVGNDCLEEAYPMPLSKRLQWVLTLLTSLRLTDWRIGEERFDRKQLSGGMGKLRFARHATALIVFDFLLLDATFWYVRHDVYFISPGMNIDEAFQNQDFQPAWVTILQVLPPRLVRCTVLAAQVFAMVSGMFYIPTLPAAALNAAGILADEWSPHAWPPFFGEFSAVTKRGLRGLWGDWWHQINRMFVSMPARALADALRLPRRSFIRYTMLVSTSFFLSGILHTGLVPPRPLTTNMTANGMRLCVASFFWVQAAGIAVECVVESWVRRWIPDAIRGLPVRILVLLWVACWLSICLPLLADPFREIGYWHHSPVGSGILQPLCDVAGNQTRRVPQWPA